METFQTDAIPDLPTSLARRSLGTRSEEGTDAHFFSGYHGSRVFSFNTFNDERQAPFDFVMNSPNAFAQNSQAERPPCASASKPKDKGPCSWII